MNFFDECYLKAKFKILNLVSDLKDGQASVGACPTQNNSTKKDYKPKYRDEELVKLTPLTEVCEQEITRVI